MQVDGSASIMGGTLIATNSPMCIGGEGRGQMTVGSGTWRVREVVVGSDYPAYGTLIVSGGVTTVSDSLAIGAGSSATGAVLVTGGTLAATNAGGSAYLIVGLPGHGELTLNGGAVIADQLYAINGADSPLSINRGTLTCRLTLVANGQSLVVGNNGGSATLQLPGGYHLMQNGLTAGGSAYSTGTIWASNCQLDSGGAVLRLGDSGVGRLVLSNSTANVATLQEGWWPGARGALELLGGTLTVRGWATLGDDTATTGSLWIAQGGEMTITNDTLHMGGRYSAGLGRLTLSNGIVRTQDVQLGARSGSEGDLTVRDGDFYSTGPLTVGNSDCSGYGLIEISGGAFLVMNDAYDATLDVRNGRVVQSGGLVHIDRIVLTNACARFDHTGGTLIYSQTVLDPALDADGDGLPNGWEQQYDLDPLSSAGLHGANGDLDGDGLSNAKERLCGTAPNNRQSVFRISGIARVSNDVRVTWTTVGGKSYVVQTNAVPGAGLRDVSPLITAPGGGESTTNWRHAGGMTNMVRRFYGVRLGP
jgi:hypothetical protein